VAQRPPAANLSAPDELISDPQIVAPSTSV